jgi:hypothetical protein
MEIRQPLNSGQAGDVGIRQIKLAKLGEPFQWWHRSHIRVREVELSE